MIEKILHFFSDPQYGIHKNVVFFCFLVLLSAGLTYLCRRYVRIMDTASERSLHHGAVPRSGGIAIVLTFCLGIITYRFVHVRPFVEFSSFWGLFFSALMVSLVSLYDDMTDRGFVVKLVAQLVGVAVLFAFGIVIREITIPFYGKVALGMVAYPLTALWIIGMTNAFNFMDGLNGLAAGLATIALIGFALFTLQHGSGFMFHVSYMLAAGCLGFLFFNLPKGRIFMGDVGSAFLGFTLGAMAIIAANYDTRHTPFMLMPILMGGCIFETFYTFLWRFRRGYSILLPHRMHPYQLLVQIGLPKEGVTVLYYLQGLLLVLISFAYNSVKTEWAKIGIFLLVPACVYILFYAVYNKACRRGLLS